MVDTQERGSRARTRQAILTAAIDVLAANPGAALGEIAAAAEVGRTTLHRYFPERTDLLQALSVEGQARIARATAQARLGDGTGAEALQRLCREYFDLGAMLSLMFAEPQILNGAGWDQPDACDTEAAAVDADFAAMVQRGHLDGSIDPELPAAWVQSLLWTSLYAGWSYVNEANTSRHEALRLLVRSLAGAVRPQPA